MLVTPGLESALRADHSEYARIAFWKRVYPRLRITEGAPITASCPYQLSAAEIAGQLSLLKYDGYLQVESLIDPPTIRVLAACVRRLDRLGIPVVFAFVYDEFWKPLIRLSSSDSFRGTASRYYRTSGFGALTMRGRTASRPIAIAPLSGS